MSLIYVYWVAEYFLKSSPDFVNNRGRVLNAHQQVDALAQAQSIGKPFLFNLLQLYSSNDAVYLSIFIMQCFNVR
jgi:sodium/potassium-transporting ATPase subunit alpha